VCGVGLRRSETFGGWSCLPLLHYLPPPDRRQLARGGAVRISSYSPTLTEVEVQFLPVAEVGIGGDARLALLPDLPLLPCPRSSFARE
jgi:hypothetical protein